MQIRHRCARQDQGRVAAQACRAGTNAPVRPRYLVGSATGGQRMQWWRGIALATASIVTIASTLVFAQQTKRVTAGGGKKEAGTPPRGGGGGDRAPRTPAVVAPGPGVSPPGRGP